MGPCYELNRSENTAVNLGINGYLRVEFGKDCWRMVSNSLKEDELLWWPLVDACIGCDGEVRESTGKEGKGNKRRSPCGRERGLLDQTAT